MIEIDAPPLTVAYIMALFWFNSEKSFNKLQLQRVLVRAL
jgi:hypothetical protein